MYLLTHVFSKISFSGGRVNSPLVPYTHNDASIVLLADYTYDVTKGTEFRDDWLYLAALFVSNMRKSDEVSVWPGKRL